MADAFVGEIRVFPYNFAPDGWLLCNGLTYLIASYQPLFSLIGSTYGGDGQTNFAVPNLNGQIPVGLGQATGDPNPVDWTLGMADGDQNTTLSTAQIPSHTHTFTVATAAATEETPNAQANKSMVSRGFVGITAIDVYDSAPTQLVALDPNMVASTGGGQPHNNLQSYLALNYCICWNGIQPTFP